MFFGKVIGTVVMSKIIPQYEGCKFVVVRRTNHAGEKRGGSAVAIDHVQAGLGDFVFMAMGKDAAWPIGKKTPVDLGIMGIIDNAETAV